MPTLACRICGRVVYTTAPLDSLFAEERRCPRCGAMLSPERRVENRRRPEQPADPDDPEPPRSLEPRADERRRFNRRRDDGPAF